MRKIIFDIDFLLQYYLNDIPAQAKKAKTIVESAVNGDLELIIDLVVICEMVWVMDSFYELDRESIVEKISNLHQTPGIRVINGDILPDALNSYFEKNVEKLSILSFLETGRIWTEGLGRIFQTVAV